MEIRLPPAFEPAALAVTGRGALPDAGVSANAAVGPFWTLTEVVATDDAPDASVTVTLTVKVPTAE